MIIYPRFKNGRDKNVKAFPTFASGLIFAQSKMNSSIDRMKTVTNERCNTLALYHSVKGVIPNKIYRQPHSALYC